MAITSIYVLVDPRTWKIRYVGKSVSPAQRYRAHCSIKRTRFNAVDRWVNELRTLGLRPKMRVVQTVEDWESAERSLISKCRESGRLLMNVEDGGRSPAIFESQSAPGYQTYRAVMAAISRSISLAEAEGRFAKAAERLAKFNRIRQSVVKIKKVGSPALAAFYAKVHERMGANFA